MGSYFYKIRNKETGKYYVGSQYSKSACKEDFFVTYFTSSQYIRNIIQKDGTESFEIVKLIERDDARNYESYYLQKCYRLLGKTRFLETFYNRSLAPGILLDEEITSRQTETKRRRWDNGETSKPCPPNWKGKQRSENMKRRLSQSKMGHTVSEETRQKLRDANLGKSQSQKTKEKRANSLATSENAYGKKHWLFISPNQQYYYTIGKRNQRLRDLGLSEGPGFFNYVNTGLSPKQGKNIGWLFYEGKSTIEELLKTVNQKNLIHYE